MSTLGRSWSGGVQIQDPGVVLKGYGYSPPMCLDLSINPKNDIRVGEHSPTFENPDIQYATLYITSKNYTLYHHLER